MSSAPSIRSRLARALALLAIGWALAVAAALWVVIRHEVHELLDDGLLASAQALAAVLAAAPSGTDGADGAATSPAVPAAAPGTPAQTGPRPDRDDDAPIAWQLVDAAGRIEQRSPGAPATALLRPTQPGFADAGDRWRVVAVALAGGRWLLVGQSRAERLETALEVAGFTIGAALVAGLLGMAWLRRRIEQETAPLVALRGVLAAYEPLAPGRRLPAPARAELEPVHDAVEALGRRLARRVRGEHAFAGHAAHALRTPLAGIDAQLAVLLLEAPDAMRPRLERLRGASTRLAAVVAALLTLFRSGSELRREPVDVGALLARMPIDGLTPVVSGPPLASADPDLLAAVLINLIENAQRHGARRVDIRTTPQALRLEDDGRGIDAEGRARLQAAVSQLGFGSDESARSAGPGTDGAGPADDATQASGLGLVLAARVAAAHGGRLLLPAVTRGFAVALTLAPEAEAPA